ncbi:hypothetical protein [Methanococcus vannielii]|uniref:hypothetical protein n=1 Tax=Methanococcus vannielii TaxID=2187 RepID=UPI00064F60D1|nr:hypothetical protein [Methanococcus vannielii]
MEKKYLKYLEEIKKTDLNDIWTPKSYWEIHYKESVNNGRNKDAEEFNYLMNKLYYYFFDDETFFEKRLKIFDVVQDITGPWKTLEDIELNLKKILDNSAKISKWYILYFLAKNGIGTLGNTSKSLDLYHRDMLKIAKIIKNETAESVVTPKWSDYSRDMAKMFSYREEFKNLENKYFEKLKDIIDSKIEKMPKKPDQTKYKNYLKFIKDNRLKWMIEALKLKKIYFKDSAGKWVLKTAIYKEESIRINEFIDILYSHEDIKKYNIKMPSGIEFCRELYPNSEPYPYYQYTFIQLNSGEEVENLLLNLVALGYID